MVIRGISRFLVLFFAAVLFAAPIVVRAEDAAPVDGEETSAQVPAIAPAAAPELSWRMLSFDQGVHRVLKGITIEGNKFIIKSPSGRTNTGYYPFEGESGNRTLQAKVMIESGSSPAAMLVPRWGGSDWIGATVTPDGQCAIAKFFGNDVQNNQPRQQVLTTGQATTVVAGLGNWNMLTVATAGNTFTLAVNGETCVTAEEDSLSAGNYGIGMVNNIDSPGVMQFDMVAIAPS